MSEGVVVGKGLVFFGSGDNGIHAIDAATSIEAWDFWTDAATDTSTPVYDRGVLYAASESSLYALDAATGHLLWTTPVPCGGAQNLLLLGNALYDAGCRLARVNISDGSIQWVAPGIVCHDRCHIASDGTRLFVPTRVGVDAVDAATGDTLWTLTTGPETRPVQFVSYHDGSVYFGTSGAGEPAFDDLHFYLYRVDASDGTVIWQRDQNYLGLTASPVVTGNTLIARIAAGGTNYLEAFSVSDGSVRWFTTLGGMTCPVCGSPIVVGGTVWLTTEGFGLGITPQRIIPGASLVSFNVADGSLANVVQPPGVVYGMGTPAYDGSSFYVGYRTQLQGGYGGIWSAGDLVKDLVG